MASDQPRNGPRSCARDVQQIADDLDRDARGEVFDQVGLGSLREVIQQAVDQRLDLGFHASDRPLVERAHDEPAHARMQRRIVEHQAGGVMLVERAVAEFRPELGFLSELARGSR